MTPVSSTIGEMIYGTQGSRAVGEDVEKSPDDGDLHLDLNTNLIGKPSAKKDLNIVNDYRPDWTCVEAYRESYQNWRDGILKSFDLDLSRFLPTYIEKGREFIIEARHPDNENLLGYIEFKGDKDGNCMGGLKIVNFEATLRFSDLATGSTSKANDSGQTGQHGDGMKISSLVYRRNGYDVRHESGGFSWHYIYENGNFICSLTRMNAVKLKEIKQKDKGQPRTRNHHAWEDVCLIVGKPGKIKDVNGTEAPGKRLNIIDFKEWITVTLDINPPKDIIRTIHGDLIRDPKYRGHMYLRGLLLPRRRTQRQQYVYGYNFVKGNTSSDRDALSSAIEESEGIIAIWSAAIRADRSSNSELLTDYTNLLLSSIGKKGDVMMYPYRNGWEPMPRDIAKKVWEKMLTLNMSEEGRAAFYYRAGEGKDEAHAISKNLRKNPTPLGPDLWRILRKYSLCRTPSEELLHLFSSAEVVSPGPDSIFAASMRKMLQCLLFSSPATRDMELTFVDGEHLDVDAGFFAGIWKVHSKWLTWAGAHEQAFCEEDESGTFSCDHAVLQLWDIMISQLIATGNHPRIAAGERWLKSMARIRLSQMPRSVECRPTQKKGELVVTWESTDSHRHKHKTVRVTLHLCCREQAEILSKHCLNHDEWVCSCPSHVSEAVSDGVTFSDLDSDHFYYPFVSRDVEGAFVGQYRGSVSPLKHDVIVPRTPKATTAPTTRSVDSGSRPATVKPIDPRSNYQPPSVSEDDEMEDNGSLYQPPSRSSSPSVPTATPAPPAPPAPPSPRPPPERSNTARVDLPERSKKISYIPGTKLEHKSLDWGGSFPGSHDFYRTREHPDQDIYILKPKVGTKKPRHKRVHSGGTDRGNAKRPRTSMAASQADASSYIVIPSSDSEEDADSRATRGSPFVRGGQATATPRPEGGVTYRY